MARGINKVILIGNLGNDPETRTSQQGAMVTSISIATDESYKDKNTGQVVPRTEWHNVTFFNRLAEIASEYLRKGSKVYVEGRLQTNKWQDQNGVDRYTTRIIAHELQMLSGQPEGQQPAQQQQQRQAQQRPQQQSVMAGNPRNYAQQQAQNYQQNQGQQNQPNDFDDDIPF